MYITWQKVLSICSSFVILVCAVFLIAIAIKSGVDGTSFVDAWNSVWGITSTPDTPVVPDDSGAGEAIIENALN